MKYRSASEKDLKEICSFVNSAIVQMENNDIFQWDNSYPAPNDFLADIQKGQLYVGISDEEIAVVYALNKEYDVQYRNGKWRYPDREFRILHRLCVSPKYQRKGAAKDALRHIEAELRKSGIEAIRLDVFSSNPHALALYLNSGYEKVGTAEWRKGKFFLMEKYL